VKVGQSAPFTVAAIGAAPICGLTNDATNRVPNATTWTNFTPPAVGGTYTDALYGCPVKRITNSASYGHAIHHYYATVEPMSAGDTKLIVLDDDSGSWFIIDVNGNVVVSEANMPGNNNGGMIIWDRTNDNVFWLTAGNALQKCTISGNSVNCITNQTFTEYSGKGIVIPNETDMTPNGWIPLFGQNTTGGTFDIFMWNPGTLTKSPVYTTSCTGTVQGKGDIGCFHKAITTPNDGIIIQFSSAGTGRDQGNIIWESPWPATPPHYENITNHEDTGKDLSGNEVAVSEDYQDSTTLCGFNPAVIILPNTVSTCPFNKFSPTNPGWHVSYRDWPAGGWIVYSAQGDNNAERFNNDGSYAAPSSGNWNTYDNEILLVRVDSNNDPTKLYRLALAHSRNVGGGFWADPRAAISFDGKYVIFDSNAAWGATGCGSLTNCTDIYLIKIH